MADSGEDHEDGEILEEGEEPESPTPPTNGVAHEGNGKVHAASVPHNPVKQDRAAALAPASEGLLPRPPVFHRPAPELVPHQATQTPTAPLLPPPMLAASPSGVHVGAKRPHSEVERANIASTTGGSYRQPRDFRAGNEREYGGSSAMPPRDSSRREPRRDDVDERYTADLITRFPRQVVASNVLLNFGTWVEAFASRSRKRVDTEDMQDMVLRVVDHNPNVSPFLMDSLVPHKPAPTKVCIVLLGNVHPSVLQRYRPELPFFDTCSSMPCTLSKADQLRRQETPLPELLFRFPKPPVDTTTMPVEDLFYGHELTFLLSHAFGYNDELILQPSGRFSRKSQPQGGTWELDGDLLHLKWRQQRKPADDSNGKTVADDGDDDSFTLDVLVAEDSSMRYFRSDPLTDKTYARETPNHLAGRPRPPRDPSRRTRISLVKATIADVPRALDGTLIRQNSIKNASGGGSQQGGEAIEDVAVHPLRQEDFEYYVLSAEELVHHSFPVDVQAEQAALQVECNGMSRDTYVQSGPRPESHDAEEELRVYALDCEMCETDLGHELTRITVVDVNSTVVYDQLVKPQSTIINYHTEFSGITAETLQSTRCILADVQRELLEKFLFEDTVLVGHSLTSDLRALRIVHLKIADTAILYPHQRGFPFRTSLKFLTKTFLGKDIQTKIQEGHDSAEDAIAAMELLNQKIRKGPMFGVPEAAFISGAYETLMDKLSAKQRRLAMIRYDHHAALAADPTAIVHADKPWQLYASGDLQTQMQSPLEKAEYVMRKRNEVDGAMADVGDDAPYHALSAVSRVAKWGDLKERLAEAAKRGDDVCWVEVNQVSGRDAAEDFLYRHDKWMTRQLEYCQELEKNLRTIRDEVISEGTLLMVVPQGDLSMLRYIKALNVRSKWRDAPKSSNSIDEMKAALSDAFKGVWDGCIFLTQK